MGCYHLLIIHRSYIRQLMTYVHVELSIIIITIITVIAII